MPIAVSGLVCLFVFRLSDSVQVSRDLSIGNWFSCLEPRGRVLFVSGGQIVSESGMCTIYDCEIHPL